MKKAKSGNRGSAPKGIDEYLAEVPEPARSTLNKMRAAIRSAVPSDATETISYKIPAFKRKNGLVWFAAFSDHCSLFPTASVIEGFRPTEGFLYLQGNHSLPHGQAAADCTHKENGEGTGQAGPKQETAIIGRCRNFIVLGEKSPLHS